MPPVNAGPTDARRRSHYLSLQMVMVAGEELFNGG
jgi:hypothetical protein